ncbi:ferredoxin [Rhodococcus opacus]|uniref:Ferredoxin n=1 Tax=Rhodococcus opacus TaxID=37919 RepID=A0A2S8J6H4_RHOOP|nr:ferredoxin [Rhodococcus opacus]PQP22595.1 ferredoxin [Rhodococcus opacus]
MRVEIDTTKCQGHGRCYLLAPEVFDMDEEGMGIVTDLRPAVEYLDSARSAAENCPETAISMKE